LEDEENAVIVAGDLELDDDTHEVRRSGILIDLSPTEFKLLRYLMLNTNRVLSKSQILDHVWEYDFGGDTGIVESYISYLRRKIDVTPETDAAGHPRDGMDSDDPDQARGRLHAAHTGIQVVVHARAIDYIRGKRTPSHPARLLG